MPTHISRPSGSSLDVLAIDEVLRMIIRHMRRRFRDLLSCALTCQAFKEGALDQLWEDIPNFGCLLRVWNANGLLDINSWQLTRIAYQEDWERFDYYASRIRYVGSRNNRNATHLDENLILQTNAALPVRAGTMWPLLPKLRGLRVNLDGSTSLMQMRLLLKECTTLTSITVNGGIPDESSWRMALELIRDNKSAIQHLSVGAMQADWQHPGGESWENWLDIHHIFFDLFQKHPIKTASIPSSCLAHQELFHRTQLLNSLVSLTINGQDDWDIPVLPIRIQLDGPISLSCNSPGLVRACCSGVQWKNLTTIDVNEDDSYSRYIYWRDLREVLRGLGLVCPALESFQWDCSIGDDEDLHHTSQPEPSLSPLFSCSQLKIFSLRTFGGEPLPSDFDLTDQDWERAAKSWDALHVLTFDVMHQEIDPSSSLAPELLPRASLLTVAHFAKHCRKMTYLEIPIGNAYATELDATTVTFSSQMGYIDLSGSYIRHGDQSSRQLRSTAQFLAKITGDSGADIVSLPIAVHWNCSHGRKAKRHCREWDLEVNDCYEAIRSNNWLRQRSVEREEGTGSEEEEWDSMI
ncbi:hypothetical protein FRB94_009020 [Tulasnella sp. JGI-2019a]|nr:hypothetical protein FRB93_003451 [Tulasnella sp. JGI-2019a]KAG9014862.1 hypothetical protein FRB94_009020 [Tulasnella sp. JGI-2019a]KAG9039976.1 hypothetical protein FRB95_004448 [Tulasnella sp. JGI-2019a]